MSNAEINILLVDDDPEDIEILKSAINDSPYPTNIVSTCNSAEECIDFLDKDIPNLVFLDIEMPRISGHELAETILAYENPPHIIFVTGRKDFAVKAFELAAVDYVTKPFEQERISKSIKRISDLVSETEDLNKKIIDVVKNLKDDTQKVKKLLVKDYKERTIRFIEYDSIKNIERIDRKVTIFTNDGKIFPTYYSIEALHRKLNENKFVKANPRLIINLDFVEHMLPNGDGSYEILLKDDKNKPMHVTRGCAKAILDFMSVK